jgi:hypothetical protein
MALLRQPAAADSALVRSLQSQGPGTDLANPPEYRAFDPAQRRAG